MMAFKIQSIDVVCWPSTRDHRVKFTILSKIQLATTFLSLYLSPALYHEEQLHDIYQRIFGIAIAHLTDASRKNHQKEGFCLSPLLCPCVSMPITRGLECTEFYVGSLIQSHVVGSIRRDESFSTSWRNMSRLSTVKSWRKHFVAGVAFPCPGFFNAVGASTLQQFEFV